MVMCFCCLGWSLCVCFKTVGNKTKRNGAETFGRRARFLFNPFTCWQYIEFMAPWQLLFCLAENQR